MKTEIEVLNEEMTKLYLIGTVNQGKVQGSQIEITPVWINQEAKENYDRLQARLLVLQSAEQTLELDREKAGRVLA